MDDMIELVCCWKCGSFINSNLRPQIRLYCGKCKIKVKTDEQKRLEKYLELKAQIALDRAMRILEKQNADIYNYYDEYNLMKEILKEEPTKFASSHEILTAMELVRNRIKVKNQHKILRHKVDFYIESMKVVLEVDGYMHDFTKLKDSKRDVDILNELGTGWEVVRIPTKYIEQNLKQLVPAIKQLKMYKQKLRKENGGYLPFGFSKRDNKLYESLKILNDELIEAEEEQ